jgi:replication-associated recombination protein RarA
LRDAHGAANERAGNAKNYLYSHELGKNISGQAYMLTQEKFYFPKQSGAEVAIVERLGELENLRKDLKRNV